MDKEKNKTVCASCGGSGELAFFQGESRFLLTREECPVCAGLGYIETEEESVQTEKNKNGDST